MDEKLIAKYMKSLGLTREEAIQLIEDDKNDVSVDLTSEQKKTAKAMAQADRNFELKPRKREPKIDEEKRFLLRILDEALCHFEGGDLKNVKVVNFERQIDLVYKDEEYSITLTKHRKPKEKS